MKRLKILISAYACRPDMGSEPGVGWNTIQELAKYHQVWVLTREDNRSAIEAVLPSSKDASLQFVYCEPPPWARWWKPTQLPHYYFWQVGAYSTAQQLHREIGFDLGHHVTYVRYSTPSFLVFLPIPFIWGPVGGGEYAPRSFWPNFSTRGKIYEIFRSLAHWLGEKDPFARLTAQRSTLVRATTADTADRLRLMGATEVEIFSESGLSQAEIDRLSQCSLPASSPIRFISMARLLHWKGLHLGLQAFAKANLPEDAEYWILGEGPELPTLQALAQELKVAKRVKFWGKLPRTETLQRLSECHVLLHPSLHDSGGWVCLEAMAAGRPVVCLDTGGPSVQVTEATGFKVPARDPQQAVQNLADALTRLAKDVDLRVQMGQAGQQRVQENFSWEVKGQQLAALYSDLLNPAKVHLEEVTKCTS